MSRIEYTCPECGGHEIVETDCGEAVINYSVSGLNLESDGSLTVDREGPPEVDSIIVWDCRHSCRECGHFIPDNELKELAFRQLYPPGSAVVSDGQPGKIKRYDGEKAYIDFADGTEDYDFIRILIRHNLMED